MGRFTDLLPSLKSAVLSIRTEGDNRVAAELADAFGPYGVPLTTLTRVEAAAVAAEFVSVQDWDFDQGAITRFLGQFVSLFPDETFALLLDRIERNRVARDENRPGFGTFGLLNGHISFRGVPLEKRLELAQISLHRALQSDAGEEDSDLFWAVAGGDDDAYDLILRQAHEITGETLVKLTTLLDKAIPRLVFVKLQFVRQLLGMFHGADRERIVEAIAYQSHRAGGGFFAGSAGDFIEQSQQDYRESAERLPEDPDLADLVRAIRRLL
jgi:hypothetical protein